MPKEDSIISGSKVKYKGVFDSKLLYNKLRDWFMRKKYGDPCEGGEKKYAEKVKPSGKQIEIVWEASKSEEAGYFSLANKMSIMMRDIVEVEVDRDGKKIKLDKGEIEIEFNSSLTRNAKGDWDENGFMFKLYERYIIKHKIDEKKIDVYKDTTNLMDEVKNFFNLYKF